MEDDKRVGQLVQPMKVGSGAYLAMAAMYREWAVLVRAKNRMLSNTERDRIAQLLDDASKDYEATAKEMSGAADA